MQPAEWSRPERAEVLQDGKWVKCHVAHRMDGKSVVDPTLAGLRNRMEEVDRA